MIRGTNRSKGTHVHAMLDPSASSAVASKHAGSPAAGRSVPRVHSATLEEGLVVQFEDLSASPRAKDPSTPLSRSLRWRAELADVDVIDSPSMLRRSLSSVAHQRRGSRSILRGAAGQPSPLAKAGLGEFEARMREEKLSRILDRQILQQEGRPPRQEVHAVVDVRGIFAIASMIDAVVLSPLLDIVAGCTNNKRRRDGDHAPLQPCKKHADAREAVSE
mmetsp:Transcript_19874/g.46027  ORF Transcript_19874/g.46027 Transcript_19874/m.46027 type:complete len:219 (+) Transcript_19874:85-741(+)